jgi:hypothetical protein
MRPFFLWPVYVYSSNSSARLYCFPDDHQFTEVEQVSFGLSLFYDVPEPLTRLYDELMNLSSTNTVIFQGTFLDYVSTRVLPTYSR